MSFFNNLYSSLIRIKNRAEPNPARDWSVLTLLTLLVFIAIVVWNVMTFETVSTGGTLSPTTLPPAAPLLDQKAIDAVHALFQARADEENKYVTGTYHFTDPSQ